MSLTPSQISPSQTLVTEFGDLGNNRFLDPNTKQSFKFDHLRKEASDVTEYSIDERAEPWRHALDDALTKYRDNYYKHGVSAVSIDCCRHKCTREIPEPAPFDPGMGSNWVYVGFSRNQDNRGSSGAYVTYIYCGLSVKINMG